MKLTLIFPSWTQVFGSNKEVAQDTSTLPPLNLLYLAAIAEQAGHTVQFIDAEAERVAVPALIERIKSFHPDLIGITATTPTFHIAKNYAESIKKELKIPIVIGGPHTSYFKEKVFDSCFDLFVVGQCENTFQDLLSSVINNYQDIEKIPGILYRDKTGNIKFTGENLQIENLDLLPFPARHLSEIENYQVRTNRGRKQMTTIMTSRGCPFDCVFCSTTIYGRKVRRRSLANVIDEIVLVQKKYSINHFFFMDDTLTLDREYILQLCDEIERHNLNITWEGSTRANAVDEILIKRMAECGLIRISFGLESAVPKIRDIIKKRIPLESYAIANKLTNRYEIETINSVMLGLPGDTRETINTTIDFVKKAKDIHTATFGIAIPYPGSEMFTMAKQELHGLKLLTEDFSKYQRYNSAVMQVNNLQPHDLLKLQRQGLLRIYFTPWRIMPLLKRFRIRSLITPFLLSLIALIRTKRGN